MKKTNLFITAALEELQKEVNTTAQIEVGQSIAAVADPATSSVTETNIDSSKDAVAELMEKNTELQDTNTELQSETFDNDVDSIETVSDTVTGDLEEAVQAGAALEELAHIAELAVKTGQANVAGVAGMYMALEQISIRAGLGNVSAALESETLQLEGPSAQASAIGKEASEKSKSIIKRLIDGIKRIIGWITGVIRNLLARSAKLSAKAKELIPLVSSIDESKIIDSSAFITSLRLVEGGGDANKQFEEYTSLAIKTLYGFFNDSFVNKLQDTFINDLVSKRANEQHDPEAPGLKDLDDTIKLMLGVIFTEHGTGADANVPNSVAEKDLTVGKTPACVGGVQLYLAATVDRKPGIMGYCNIGLVKTQPKFDTPETIPVVNKKLATDMLAVIQKWMTEQHALETRLKKIESRGRDTAITTASITAVHYYLSTLTAIATSCIPHFLRLNIQNSANFIAYVEKSIAASKTGAGSEEK